MVMSKGISEETRLAVENVMLDCQDEKIRKEPLNRLYALFLNCSKKYSLPRKDIAKSLDVPRHTVEKWITDLRAATPDRIEAIGRCKYTLSDIYHESGRERYETTSYARPDSEKITMAKKEILTTLHLTGISEYCFTTPDNRMYFNEDGKRLICDMLVNRVERSQEDQNPESFSVYSDIRNSHFDIKYKSHYDWMLEMACSNLRDISTAYPDLSGVTEYYTEDEIRHNFWRFVCLVNENYSALPGMSLLGELPDGFYDESHDAILDDIIATFDPLIVDEIESCKKEEIEYVQQRWIKYLNCVSDIRREERKRILEEVKQYPGLYESIKVYSNAFLSTYDWDAFRKKTKSKEQKWGSNIRKKNKDVECNWKDFLSIYKKKPEERTEEERSVLYSVYALGERCAKIRPRMSTGEVIELANARLNP